jgi:hypothetical protein
MDWYTPHLKRLNTHVIRWKRVERLCPDMKCKRSAEFEVLTPVTMTNAVLWVVALLLLAACLSYSSYLMMETCVPSRSTRP